MWQLDQSEDGMSNAWQPELYTVLVEVGIYEAFRTTKMQWHKYTVTVYNDHITVIKYDILTVTFVYVGHLFEVCVGLYVGPLDELIYTGDKTCTFTGILTEIKNGFMSL